MGEKPKSLVVATSNQGKVREYGELLKSLPVSVHNLDEFPAIDPPEETGATFEDNARLKANFYSKALGQWVIADDSGLCVDALDGKPGVFSARFAGEGTSYAEKMRVMLEMLVNAGTRTARFECVIALSDPLGDIPVIGHGTCEGSIANEPRGSGGFGYDPLFIPNGYDSTFGELSADEKHSISHRRTASDELIRQMLDFIGL
jgi:XTP/dITP diphosphohydrolase